jgi:hypothetical protein
LVLIETFNKNLADTGERRFGCVLCGKALDRSDSFKKHLESKRHLSNPEVERRPEPHLEKPEAAFGTPRSPTAAAAQAIIV